MVATAAPGAPAQQDGRAEQDPDDVYLPFVVERTGPPLRSFSVRDAKGRRLAYLPFRDVLALHAVRAGRARARWVGRHGQYGFFDRYLEPECDDFGIGYGTLTGLIGWGDDWRALIARPTDEGPLQLTELGAAVLDAIVALTFPYVWSWNQRHHWIVRVDDAGRTTEIRPPRVFDRCRRGERCRVLIRSRRMNSALIEFEDGYRVITSRSGLRRRAPHPKETAR